MVSWIDTPGWTVSGAFRFKALTLSPDHLKKIKSKFYLIIKTDEKELKVTYIHVYLVVDALIPYCHFPYRFQHYIFSIS